MSFFTNPSINGIQLPFNQLAGPLSKLFKSEGAGNFVYPSDLTTNPALNHAIQFSIYDWDTPFSEAYNTLPDAAGQAVQKIVQNYNKALGAWQDSSSALAREGGSTKENLQALEDNANNLKNALIKAGPSAFQIFESSFSATTYKPRQKGPNLATISLYLPDNLHASWDSNYNSVSMTQELGKLGFIASAADLIKNMARNGTSNITAAKILEDPNTKSILSDVLGKAGGVLGLGGNIENLTKQSLGQFVNPQMQLIYQGRDFRNFSMTFIFTPKSSAEAQTVNNIIDAFTYFSSPGVVNGDSTNPGRYLTPPQLMSVKMVFTGENGLAGSVINQLQQSLNNVGLGFLGQNQSITNVISKGQQAKIFNIKECVITNVTVDYAPNGWAAFNDGYPVQTTMTLNMMETTMFTKADINNSAVTKGYKQYLSDQQAQKEQQAALLKELNTNPYTF